MAWSFLPDLYVDDTGKTEDGVQEDGVVREMSVFLAVLVSRRPLAQHVTSDAIGGLLALDAS